MHLCMTKGTILSSSLLGLNAKPVIDFGILSLRIGHGRNLNKAIKELKKARNITTEIDDQALLVIGKLILATYVNGVDVILVVNCSLVLILAIEIFTF